jgi:fatty acid CoA ligase FadD9
VSSPINFEESPTIGDDPSTLLFQFTRLVETDPQARDALPIDEIAALIADADASIGQILQTVMDRYADGIRTYNVDPGLDNGISLDTMVDWMIEGGRRVTRIDDYQEWVSRCETAMLALPPAQRRHSLHEVMAPYRYPGVPTNGPTVPSACLRAAVKAAGVELPLSKELIDKYVGDLNRLGL